MSNDDKCTGGGDCPSEKILNKEKIEEMKERMAIQLNMSGIQHKIIVLSGKGGVGKSTVAANIAVALSLKDKKIGLIDIDIHGPSIPKMLGLEGMTFKESESGLLPIDYSENLKVMSIGFLLRNDRDAIIWRGPLKHGLIRQFLRDVRWGDLNYLIVDSPPGTGDEPISIIQLLEDADGAVIVTTPQDVALTDVRKAITFCRHVNLPIIGIVENMSGFVCPHCGNVIDIFKSGGGKKLAEEMGVPFLGSIPLEPNIVDTGDSGKPYIQYFQDSQAAKAFNTLIEPILSLNVKIAEQTVKE